jgi:integrase
MSETERDLDRVQTRVCERRREQAERDWRKNPLTKYEAELYDRLTERDAQRRMQKIRRFEDWLLTEIAPAEPEDIGGVRDAVGRDVAHWRDNDLLQDPALSVSTVQSHLQLLKSLYARLNEVNAYAGNPARDPLSELRDEYESEFDTDRPFIPFSHLQAFLAWLDRPFSRAMWLLAFKLAMRKGETLNLDLRCLHIDHPVFWDVIDKRNITLDPRVRHHPDTLLVYGNFTEGTEVPNDKVPGWEGSGEVREVGNKRKQDDGTVLPIDSELKTALIEWLLVRTPTYQAVVNPVFTIGASSPRRISENAAETRLWKGDSYIDSIQNFSAEHTLSECPTCGESVIAENLKNGEKTGRRYRCRNCTATHWRSIHWDTGLETPQKVVYHQGRHTFSSAHTPANSELHDGAIPKAVRTEAIRGDSNQQGDTEDQVYIEGQYKNFEQDVRQPYLDGIYKFGLYDNPIPAVGEGWNR